MTAQLGAVRRTLMVLMFTLTGISGFATDESTAPGSTEMPSPHRGPSHSMNGDELFAKLLEHNRRRDALLDRYSAVRTYRVASDKGKVYAEEVVRMEYEAPDRKHFVIASETGSSLVR